DYSAMRSMRTAQTLYSGIFDDEVERGVRQEVRRRLLELHERDEHGVRTYGLGDKRVPGQLAAPRCHTDPRAGVTPCRRASLGCMAISRRGARLEQSLHPAPSVPPCQ